MEAPCRQEYIDGEDGGQVLVLHLAELGRPLGYDAIRGQNDGNDLPNAGHLVLYKDVLVVKDGTNLVASPLRDILKGDNL